MINSAFRLAEGSFVEGDRINVESVSDFLATGTFLLATSDLLIRGCVYVEQRGRSDITAPDRAYLGLLAVDPGLQQFGLGSLLMQEAEGYCRALGAGVIEIKVVHLRDELLGFYGRRGYVKTGTSAFPSEVATKQPCHFVEMSKQLLLPGDDESA